MSKKSQIQQVFIFILVAIILGIVVLVGYKSINSLTKSSCETEKVSFITQMEKMVLLYKNYGDERIVHLRAPCGYSKLCIINSIDLRDIPAISGDAPDILSFSWKNNVSQNVFMEKSGKMEAVATISNVKAKNSEGENGYGWVCVDTEGSFFNLKIIGMGSYALITIPE